MTVRPTGNTSHRLRQNKQTRKKKKHTHKILVKEEESNKQKHTQQRLVIILTTDRTPGGLDREKKSKTVVSQSLEPCNRAQSAYQTPSIALPQSVRSNLFSFGLFPFFPTQAETSESGQSETATAESKKPSSDDRALQASVDHSAIIQEQASTKQK
jgi:hypothetical protein